VRLAISWLRPLAGANMVMLLVAGGMFAVFFLAST
jgi:hypothetical protein